MSPDDSQLLMVARHFTVEEIEKSAARWDEQAAKAVTPEWRESSEKSAARCRRAIQLLKEQA